MIKNWKGSWLLFAIIQKFEYKYLKCVFKWDANLCFTYGVGLF